MNALQFLDFGDRRTQGYVANFIFQIKDNWLVAFEATWLSWPPWIQLSTVPRILVKIEDSIMHTWCWKTLGLR
jgi:ABC-type microcin C transport system permease subunit YejE